MLGCWTLAAAVRRSLQPRCVNFKSTNAPASEDFANTKSHSAEPPANARES